MGVCKGGTWVPGSGEAPSMPKAVISGRRSSTAKKSTGRRSKAEEMKFSSKVRTYSPFLAPAGAGGGEGVGGNVGGGFWPEMQSLAFAA